MEKETNREFGPHLTKEEVSEALAAFQAVGLEAVEVKNKRGVIGGRQIKIAEVGFEIAQPEFSVFWAQDSGWTASMQNLDRPRRTEYVIGISQSFLAAAKYICCIYEEWQKKGILEPEAVSE